MSIEMTHILRCFPGRALLISAGNERRNERVWGFLEVSPEGFQRCLGAGFPGPDTSDHPAHGPLNSPG